MSGRSCKRYFLDKGPDDEWYLVEAAYRQQWRECLKGADPHHFEPPDFVDWVPSPQDIEFSLPTVEWS